MRKHIMIAVAAATAAFAATPSNAASLVTDCATLGIDDIVPNAEACVGYFDGNVLNTSVGGAAKADEVAALNALGLTGSIFVLEKLDGSGNFVTPLNGLTYIGVHYGNGTTAPINNRGGVTAFYRFNAGVNLDEITFNNGSVSGVVLYSTGPAVPEPATWAMMLSGFGLMGAAMRRRTRTTVSFA